MPPNIVFMFSDQQRYDTLAAYGNDWIRTPNLNRLAEGSFVFERAYVAQPVCTPARATLLTGLYPHTAGPTINHIPLPESTKTFAEYVDDSYETAWFGKWHLGDDTLKQHGWKHWISAEDGHTPSYSRPDLPLSDYHRYLESRGYKPDGRAADGRAIFSSGQRSGLPPEDQMAHFLGRTAVDFIDRNAGNPFVLFVSTFEPHSPYSGPYNDLYDPATLPVGPAFLQTPETASLYHRTRAAYYSKHLTEGGSRDDPYMRDYLLDPDLTLDTELDWRILRAQYLSNITLVDEMAGMVMDALERNGLADNTIVVFTSEHGEMAGDHRMLEKRSLYEESARVPLLMRVPGMSDGGRRIAGNVGQIDLLPTLLDLIGQQIPEGIQGNSLKPVLVEGGDLERNDVFIEWNGTGALADRNLGSEAINLLNTAPWRGVVSGDWKFCYCPTDRNELYNLRDDPHEMSNLVDDPAHRDVVYRMAARLRHWGERTGDDVPITIG